MLFSTDKQTLEDLNIFGKHGSDAVFNIFNRCSTRGGATILEDMFRYPLSDHGLINRRSDVIRFLAASPDQFPFSAIYFEAAETYLANHDERTRLSARDNSMARRVGNIIAADMETRQISKGVQALVALMKEARLFVESAGLSATPVPEQFQAEKEAIAAILLQPELAPLLSSADKPDYHSIVAWDTLLRFRNREVMYRLLRHLYHLDVYFAVGKVACERGFAFPKALPAVHQVVTIKDLYHPHVKNAVPNTITITPQGNVIFLTGANMAGKSTFMKSLGIGLFLAHMGFPVPATTMEFAVFDGIYTTINLPDNLGMGASHFYAEVLRVKKIVNELGSRKRLFVVFDELFRGTNVKDACEATIALTAGFASRQNSVFVISTHIVEAGEVLAASCSTVTFHYLPTIMNGNKPVYTYRLEAGITTDRHGMVIIENEGILEILAKGKKKNCKTAD